MHSYRSLLFALILIMNFIVLALYFTRADEERTAQRLARRIKELGYEVQIRKAA